LHVIALLSILLDQCRGERPTVSPSVPAGFSTGSRAPGDTKSYEPGDEHNDSDEPKHVGGEPESTEDEGDQKHQQD
jgi:hypothetical protein